MKNFQTQTTSKNVFDTASRFPVWRIFLAGIFFVVICSCMLQKASAADEWVVGQVTSLSGTNGADLGQGLALGQRIYFDYINSRGGVHGRKLKMISLDDRYIPDETVKLTRDLLQQHHPIALIGYRGTANTLALVKSGVLTNEGIALVGTLTGAKELQAAPNIYHVRTSYPIEIKQLVTQVVRQGNKKIGIFYADDAFGKSGLLAAQEAVSAADGEIVGKFGYDKAADKVDASIRSGAAALLAAKPSAIIMIAVGVPAVNFLQICRDSDRNIPLYSLSVVNPSEVSKALGAQKAVGIGFSQVFPFPYSDASTLTREYRKLMKKYAPEAQPNYFSLEGFINAKVLVAALQNAGPRATRADLISALDNLGELDFGNFWLNFLPNQHNGSRFTELTVIARTGNLIR